MKLSKIEFLRIVFTDESSELKEKMERAKADGRSADALIFMGRLHEALIALQLVTEDD